MALVDNGYRVLFMRTIDLVQMLQQGWRDQHNADALCFDAAHSMRSCDSPRPASAELPRLRRGPLLGRW